MLLDPEKKTDDDGEDIQKRKHTVKISNKPSSEKTKKEGCC